MKYLNQKTLSEIELNWGELNTVIESAIICLDQGESVQPIKPYLRFKDIKNRIISMPAYLGSNFNVAGIKWIASFPDNIDKGKPRAHSVTILNSADTGEPVCIINTALLSILRTTTVSRVVLNRYWKYRNIENPKIGIIGFGPIGQYHLKMSQDFFKDTNAEFFLYDIKEIKKSNLENSENITIVNSWQDAYDNADIFITCTVSKERYIDRKPKGSSLHLNISLRDYKPETITYFREGIIVDKWEEICRENTDIEMMHEKYNLQKHNVKTLVDVVVHNCLDGMVGKMPIMFNPMGMSIFDIATADYFHKKSTLVNIGLNI